MKPFSIRTALQQSFSVLKANFAAFFVIAALMAVLLHISTRLFTLEHFVPASLPTDPAEFETIGFLVPVYFMNLATTAICGFAMLAIAYGTVRHLHGNEATVGACLIKGGANLLRLLVLAHIFVGAAFVLNIILTIPAALIASILASASGGAGAHLMIMIAVAFGSCLFLTAFWFPVVPVLIAEQHGILGTLKRSQQLSKGNRLAFFRLLLIILFAGWAAGLIVDAVSFGSDVVWAILNPVILALILAFFSIALAVIYDTIRRDREGIQPGELGSI